MHGQRPYLCCYGLAVRLDNFLKMIEIAPELGHTARAVCI